MLRHRKRQWFVVAGFVVLVSACVTLKMTQPGKSPRGLLFSHGVHVEEGMDCTDCHLFEEGESSLPNHDICSICHDIPEDKADESVDESCDLCHTDKEQKVKPYQSKLITDILFEHEPHAAKELDCKECHADPDKAALPTKPLMTFCMDCHEKSDPALNECAVCHVEIRKEVRPKSRGGSLIAHDVPSLWERAHGKESKIDPAFCAYCHDSETFCDDCHSKNPPQDHNVSWRRRTHGLQADFRRERCAACHEEDFCIKCHRNTAPSSHRTGWRHFRHGVEAGLNQQRCSVCHEEDSCVRCHQATQPKSHRASWGRPVNRHCVSCHYPATTTKCAMCHDSFDHPTALPSPHTLGIYPPNCALCHPGGLPRRAPHIQNNAVRCFCCH